MGGQFLVLPVTALRVAYVDESIGEEKTEIGRSCQKFVFWCHMGPLGATGATLGAWVPNQVEKVGINHTYHPQLVSQNFVFRNNSLPYPHPLA